MNVRQFLARFWSPLTSYLLLILACLHPGFADPVGQDVGYLFSHSLYIGYIVVTLAALVLVAWRGRGTAAARRVWWTLDIALCTFVVAQGLKGLTRLPRPSGSPTGFPSGHTLFSFALAWLMLEISPRLAPLWFAVALTVGWSRVEIHDHFTYQVLVGAVIGSAIGWAVGNVERGIVFPRFIRKRQQPETLDGLRSDAPRRIEHDF